MCSDWTGSCRSVSDPTYGDLTQTPPFWQPKYGAQLRNKAGNLLLAFSFATPASAETFYCTSFDDGNCALAYSFTSQSYW